MTTEATKDDTTKRVLILRTCAADMTSYGGFQWPREGVVIAPDWSPKPVCGQGLHGFLRGEGDGSLASWAPDAVWIAAWVEESAIINLDGKVKFPRAEIAFVGDRLGATEFLRANGCRGAIVGGTATAGHEGTATAGYGGTATAGHEGTATAGGRGTATAGGRGTATAGYGGTATAGHEGTATAGDEGILNIRWHDGMRFRIATFYVGEGGVKPNTGYRCGSAGELIEV